MIDVQNIKQQFDIIGNAAGLNHALDRAYQVAFTDLSVLITGESGTGKESFPKIIHKYSSRKHNQYIAVNCGAIPEGTIDSELFGHVKGAFTGAVDTRKGYFETVDKGTIFLDEVAELPLSTQARLLRVLETGEFIKVGSSEIQKTNVRVIAATNVNLQEAIIRHHFREDLFYRLNAVPITIPPLRDRKGDISLLFRKFAADFAEKYRMPSVHLDENAKQELESYPWPGNIRQLKNITEQISILEQERIISREILEKYLPAINNLPVLYRGNEESHSFASERELLYKVLFDMRNEINELKNMMHRFAGVENIDNHAINTHNIGGKVYGYNKNIEELYPASEEAVEPNVQNSEYAMNLAIQEKEKVRQALKVYNNKRKPAAEALGISERTLYRKIKEYDLEYLQDEV
ncbi:MAG: sigma-54 dependent transcriptional regulator [Prevotellaceae bacterium]|jgi:transcriptional regulator with PAS, ATPase and Fis domain|nr:sigma-54 dependent transcriptional regulator [Prevotellaceae bacterium]